jgi:hypothetical protein
MNSTSSIIHPFYNFFFSNNSTSFTTISFTHYYHVISSVSVLISNLTYFMILLINSKRNKLSYIHMHHINMIGLIQGILMTSWSFNYLIPPIRDSNLNNILCFTSEILWGTLKHIRAYTVLNLALFRYSAVFYNGIYKRISSKFKYIIGCLLFAWIVPLSLFFITKYTTKSTSTNEKMFCLDGYNRQSKLMYIYFGVTYLLGCVLPTILVCVIYDRIRSELKKRYKRLKIIEMICPFNSNSSSSINQNERIKKNKKLINQVILINLLEIVSLFNVLIMIVPLQEIWNDLDMDTFKHVLASLNNFILCIIPFLTLYYLPFLSLKCSHKNET